MPKDGKRGITNIGHESGAKTFLAIVNISDVPFPPPAGLFSEAIRETPVIRTEGITHTGVAHTKAVRVKGRRNCFHIRDLRRESRPFPDSL